MLYINEKVSTDKVLKLLKAIKACGTEAHQIALVKDEEVLFEMSPEPYHTTDKRMVFSISKSFTSTVVGMCYDKGLLKPEDKVIDFFPKELTENADERIKRLTVHNLLCMNTAMVDRMPNIERTGNALEAFFTAPIEDATDIFHYDNSATFMLAAIVKQVTGLNVIDIINKDLFPYVGVDSCRWTNVNGISEGYAGLYTTARHIALAMQIYAHKGVFNSKRLLSEDWVNKATSVQISTKDDNPNRWWTQGYGYQFWISPNEGFRAEGAVGQTAFILPSIGVTLAQTGVVKALDETDDAYYEFCRDFEGESTVSVEELEQFINDWYKPLPKSDKTFSAMGKTYKMDQQYRDVTVARLGETADMLECEVSNDIEWQAIRIGKGKWVRNELLCYNPIAGRVVCDEPKYQRVSFAACCEVMDENTLKIWIRFTDAPLVFELIIAAEGNKLITKTCCTNFGEGGINEYSATEI